MNLMQTERGFHPRLARNLAAVVPQETDWIVSGLLAPGALTALDGPPKTSGKTTFALAMIAALATGAPFAGMATRPARVLLLSEQTPATLRPALDRAGLTDADHLEILCAGEVRGMAWPDVVGEAAAYCLAHGIDLITVDTLAAFAGLAGDTENTAGHVQQVWGALQLAAESGLAVLAVRHTRKTGGSVGESARGSSAGTAAADIVAQLSRPEESTDPTVRILEAVGRFDSVPDRLTVRWTPAGYQRADIAGETRSRAQQAILRVLSDLGDEGATEPDIVAATEFKRTSIGEALRSLVRAGAVAQSAKASRGNPYRYWIAAKPSEGDSAHSAQMLPTGQKGVGGVSAQNEHPCKGGFGEKPEWAPNTDPEQGFCPDRKEAPTASVPVPSTGTSAGRSQPSDRPTIGPFDLVQEVGTEEIMGMPGDARQSA